MVFSHWNKGRNKECCGGKSEACGDGKSGNRASKRKRSINPRHSVYLGGQGWEDARRLRESRTELSGKNAGRHPKPVAGKLMSVSDLPAVNACLNSAST